MKVAVYLKNDVSPSIGGNFSYQEKFIKGLHDYTFKEPLEICFVGRFSAKGSPFEKRYFKIAPGVFYRLSRILTRLKINSFFKTFFGINIDPCTLLDSKILNSNNVDIILFPSQFLKAVNDFPFITMNWDAGHKTTFAFPELLEHFKFREQWYRDEIQEALAIFVESESGKKDFAKYYSIHAEKIHVIPLFPGSVVDLVISENRQNEILKKLGLKTQNFIYYPAQFWAHKNHYNLLIAFKKVLTIVKDKSFMLVLSGSDMGNKDYIHSIIRKEQLDKNVLLLGFITNEEVYTCYKNCIALVMPTFLGPTNMPLLEAQALGAAVICSDLDGHREQCGDGALYADPAVPDQWVDAILAVLAPDRRTSLINAANQFLTTSPFKIGNSLKNLEKSLIKISAIRKTFQ